MDGFHPWILLGTYSARPSNKSLTYTLNISGSERLMLQSVRHKWPWHCRRYRLQVSVDNDLTRLACHDTHSHC